MGVYEVIDCNVNAAVAVTNCDPRVRPGETAVLSTIVEEFRVFDRWGEEVFVGVEFQPNIPELGWDGRLNGELMNPQVLVYWARVRFRDGRTQVVKGDFTLIR